MSFSSFSPTGRIFALKKKAKGSGHVWKEFKAEFNANETEDDVTIEWNDGGRKRMYQRTTDTTTKVTISIMFYYTDAFANITSDIVTYIDHVLDIANQGYINSGLPITVGSVLVGQEPPIMQADIVLGDEAMR